MAILRAPGLGPIVGHTTDKCCRIWARAGDPGDIKVLLDENRRTVGVIGLMKKAGEVGPAWFFRLHREFDRTGTFVVGEDVQLGYYEDDFKAQGKSVPRKNPPKEAVPASLSPDTEYTVRVGTLTIDDPMPNDRSLADWELIKRLPDINDVKQELVSLDAEACEATFR